MEKQKHLIYNRHGTNRVGRKGGESPQGWGASLKQQGHANADDVFSSLFKNSENDNEISVVVLNIPQAWTSLDES